MVWLNYGGLYAETVNGLQSKTDSQELIITSKHMIKDSMIHAGNVHKQ